MGPHLETCPIPKKDPLGFAKFASVFLELTSKCNLRCVYCEVSNSDYRGYTMSESELAGLVDFFRTKSANLIQMNGHGESTVLPGWWRHCLSLIDAGIPLGITTNGARALDEESLSTLARFSSIVFSIDTMDPVLFSKMRRGGCLKTLLANMESIQRRGEAHGKPPVFMWSCVLTDKNVFGVPELVEAGLDLGVTHFYLCNLKKCGVDFEVKHVATMSLSDIKRAYDQMKAIQARLEGLKIEYWLMDGYLASLEEVLQAERPAPVSKLGNFHSVSTPGMTRDCLDPWTFLMARADGSTVPCCWHSPIGNWREKPIESILEGEAARKLRNDLLSGELDESCRGCPARGMIPTAELSKKVETLQASTAQSAPATDIG